MDIFFQGCGAGSACIHIIFGSCIRIQIQIRIRVKSWTGIPIEVKIQELWRLNLVPRREDRDAHNHFHEEQDPDQDPH